MTTTPHEFLRHAGRVLNSGQSRSLVVTGNVHDLFGRTANGEVDYLPLVNYLAAQWSLPGIILVTYELNGPIRFLREGDSEKMRDAWMKWRIGYDSNELAVQSMLTEGRIAADLELIQQTYDDSLRKALNNATLALELMRQMCQCSRTLLKGRPLLPERLLILIEGADMLMPEAPITSLSDVDRQRIAICHDWFSDPGYLNGEDSVVLIAESRSLLHHRVARLPQLLEVEIPSPDLPVRKQFISWFNRHQSAKGKIRLWGSQEDLARLTAGLSLHALRQLLKGAAHAGGTLGPTDVIGKVEAFIQSQLGEDIVEFKQPHHRLKQVIGFTRLKHFLKEELIPRCRDSGPGALTGAAVCGPIGSGKTFVFEAVAAELELPVLVLKNIRSQWFGQTDVLFERLRRVLFALAQVVIFVDEADTQFGGVGANAHETERRLTGKVQAMMSDPRLRGRVLWLLITARIHRLSPDLRRPGRVGDLIIPVLDPEAEDREAFLRWTVKPVLPRAVKAPEMEMLDAATQGYSAAGFASLRSELRALASRSPTALSFEQVLACISDYIPPAIQETRRYQTLQALVNCTRRSLLPDPNIDESQRQHWAEALRQLELKGID